MPVHRLPIGPDHKQKMRRAGGLAENTDTSRRSDPSVPYTLVNALPWPIRPRGVLLIAMSRFDKKGRKGNGRTRVTRPDDAPANATVRTGGRGSEGSAAGG